MRHAINAGLLPQAFLDPFWIRHKKLSKWMTRANWKCACKATIWSRHAKYFNAVDLPVPLQWDTGWPSHSQTQKGSHVAWCSDGRWHESQRLEHLYDPWVDLDDVILGWAHIWKKPKEPIVGTHAIDRLYVSHYQAYGLRHFPQSGLKCCIYTYSFVQSNEPSGPEGMLTCFLDKQIVSR